MIRSSKYQFKVGDTFGIWTVVQDWSERRHLPHSERQYVLCVCQKCHAKTLVSAYNLGLEKTGNSGQCKSCCPRGRLGRIWKNMKNRCYLPTCPSYPKYGGRGIVVCSEWKDSFRSFRDWSLENGYTETLQIDRIDNDGNYSPDNCRWTTALKNNNNRRSNYMISAFGETKSASEWARDSRARTGSLNIISRINRGHDAETAISASDLRSIERN